MAEPLYELLAPYLSDSKGEDERPSSITTTNTPVTSIAYLERLITLSLADLTSTEPTSLAQSSQSLLRSLQALSKRSHKSVIDASTTLSSLSSSLPPLFEQAATLQDALPDLEKASTLFATKYKRSADSDNEALLHRRKALLLSQNADRISSLLELPTLLSSAVSSSTPSASASGPSSTSTANYASALDLHAHIKRLKSLHPDSALVDSIAKQAEAEMRQLTAALVTSLQSQNLKLAGAMRTIGYLRRVAPELDDSTAASRSRKGIPGTSTKATLSYTSPSSSTTGPTDGTLGFLFLACRLHNLTTTLSALDPLRDLADAERANPSPGKNPGQQAERYLKRYVEIFREHSFAIVAMYRNLFPGVLPVPDSSRQASAASRKDDGGDPFAPPSPLATFVPHLADLLFATLRSYLPSVTEKAARDSLMTQILYCAGSLGRLGGDFGMRLALLEEDLREDAGGDDGKGWEWVEVMKRHRVQASRLELLASGAGAGAGTGGGKAAAAAAAAG